MESDFLFTLLYSGVQVSRTKIFRKTLKIIGKIFKKIVFGIDIVAVRNLFEKTTKHANVRRWKLLKNCAREAFLLTLLVLVMVSKFHKFS